MTEHEVMERLRGAVREAGSLRAFASRHGLTASYIHDVLNGRRAISERIAAALGVQRVVTVEWHDTGKPGTIDTQIDTQAGGMTGSEGADLAQHKKK